MQRHFFRDQSQMRTKPRHIHRDRKLDTEWSNWIAENLARGCDPEEVFFMDRECDGLVQIINQSLASPSEIGHGAANFHTSRTSHLSLLNDTFVERIDAKISMLLGIRPVC